MKKSEFRHQMIKIRDALPSATRADYDQHITYAVNQLNAFQHAGTIMIYLSYRSEVMTDAIIKKCFTLNKRVIVPVVNTHTRTLQLAEIYHDTTFNLSHYGIREPKITNKNQRQLSDVDLILSPGVAFDLSGNRLGYGGGFYDKLIASDIEARKQLSIYALAYEMQLVEKMDTNTLDQKIDGIITEKNTYHF